LLHCFKSADHCFDSRPDLLVFLQQASTLGREYVLSLFERAVLILQLVANAHQRIDPLLKSLQFVFEG
jgi:hypothetical protein